MKYLYLILFSLFTYSSLFAQTPQKMSFQTVVRDGNQTLLKSTNIGIQISILQGSDDGNSVYAERHFPQTNINGLATLEIGDGINISGNFNNINWANGPYFIKTEIDPNGGSNYNVSSVSQILSIPYALLAKNVENAPSIKLSELEDVDIINIQQGQILKWDGNSWKVSNDNTGNSNQIYTSGPGINIDGNNVISNTGDLNNTNEIQELSISGNVISLSSGGGSVMLPAVEDGDNWGTQTVSSVLPINGNGTSLNPIGIMDNSLTTLHIQNGTLKPEDFNVSDINQSVPLVLKYHPGSNAPAAISFAPERDYIAGNGLTRTAITSDLDGPLRFDITTSGVQENNVLTFKNGTWQPQMPLVSNIQTNNSLIGNGTTGNLLSINNGGVTTTHILNGTIKPEDLSTTGVPLHSVIKLVGDATIKSWQYAPGMTILPGSGINVDYSPSADGAVKISSKSSWTSLDGTVSTFENVGIGVSPTSSNIHILDNLRADIKCQNNSATARLYVGPPSGGTLSDVYFGSVSAHDLNLMTDNTTRFTLTSAGNVGIGTNQPTAKLSVNGTANKPGGGTWTVFSDKRLKKDISDYKTGLKDILMVQPVRFKYNGLMEIASDQEYVGVIAQDIKKILPSMVSEAKTSFKQKNLDVAEENYLMVDPNEFTYMLINAVKELNETNKQLGQRMDNYEKKIEEMSTRLEQLNALLKSLKN